MSKDTVTASTTADRATLKLAREARDHALSDARRAQADIRRLRLHLELAIERERERLKTAPDAQIEKELNHAQAAIDLSRIHDQMAPGDQAPRGLPDIPQPRLDGSR